MLQNDLVKVKNAYLAKLPDVLVPYSNISFEVLKLLSKKNYVGRVEVKGEEPKRFIYVELTYSANIPHMREIRFRSKPGARMYSTTKNLRSSVRQGYGHVVVSTSKGVMTSADARKNHVGGEILFEVF